MVETVTLSQDPLIQVPVNLCQLSVLVGSAYKKGDKESIYGHTSVAVLTENKEYPVLIFDYVRYGETYPEELALGVKLEGENSPRGEGILRVWYDYAAFIQSENFCGTAPNSRTTYEYGYYIQGTQAAKILNFFTGHLKTATRYKDDKYDNKGKLLNKTLKIKLDYFALGPNCTTLRDVCLKNRRV